MTAAIILERHHAFGITDSFSTSSSHVCTVFHRPTILSTKRNGAFCRYASGLSPREIQRIRVNPEHFIESAIPFSYFWRTQQPRLFSSSHYTGNIKNFPQKAYAFKDALRLRLALLGIYIVNSPLSKSGKKAASMVSRWAHSRYRSLAAYFTVLVITTQYLPQEYPRYGARESPVPAGRGRRAAASCRPGKPQLRYPRLSP